MKWFIKVLRHYADFSGRARRKEFWMFVLFNIIFSFIWTFLLTIVFVLVNNNELSEEKLQFAIRVAYMSYSAAMLLPGLAVAVRRMHDLGKSGWMLLVGLIPFLGGIWLFVLMLMDSQERGNKYGPNPKTSQETFSEPVRLKNAGVTLVIASTIAFLINIFNLISNQFPIQFNNMVEIAVDIILFAAGIFLLNEHSINKMQKKGQYAFVLILTVASIHLIISTYFLNINISNVSTFGWKAVTGSTIYTLYNLMIALFAASVLFYLQNKNLIRSLAVMTMVFSGIFLLWSVYSRMGFFYAGFEIVNLLGIFFVLMPVAYIVLAGTFYSVRNSTGEKSLNEGKL